MRPDEVSTAFQALEAEPVSLGRLRARELGHHGALLAVDDTGERHVLIGLEPDEDVYEDRKSAGVHVVLRGLESRSELSRYMDIVARIQSLYPLFGVIAAEVLEELARGTSAGAAGSIVIERWREMIDAPSAPVSIARQIGIFGELWQLLAVARLNAVPIETWAGPAKGRHDIVGVSGCDIEVKSSRGVNARIVSIHGLEQLDLGGAHELYLSCMRVEPVLENGQTIGGLLDLLSRAGMKRSDLMDRLALLGLDQDRVDGLTQPYRVTEDLLYSVDDLFPRLTRLLVSPPTQVVRVDYDLDLTSEPPTSLTDEEALDVYGRVGASR